MVGACWSPRDSLISPSEIVFVVGQNLEAVLYGGGPLLGYVIYDILKTWPQGIVQDSLGISYHR